MNAISGKLGIHLTPSGSGVSTTILPPTALPIETLLQGKEPEQAARTLGLVYNICAAAQNMAARAAFDLPVCEAVGGAVRQEGARDHARSIAYAWPRALGLKPDPLAMGLPTTELSDQLLGPQAALPETWDAFEQWIQAEETVAAEVLSVVLSDWPEDWAVVALPMFDAEAQTDWADATQNGLPVENGPACRVQDHPLLEAVEDRFGRGVLWRMTACLLDTERMLQDDPSYERPIEQSQPGVGGAHASRGIMMVTGTYDADGVQSFARVSPTDFALVDGGVLDQSLASLTGKGTDAIGFEAAVRLIVAVVDPCYPIDLTIRSRKLTRVEPGHA